MMQRNKLLPLGVYRIRNVLGIELRSLALHFSPTPYSCSVSFGLGRRRAKDACHLALNNSSVII